MDLKIKKIITADNLHCACYAVTVQDYNGSLDRFPAKACNGT